MFRRNLMAEPTYHDLSLPRLDYSRIDDRRESRRELEYSGIDDHRELNYSDFFSRAGDGIKSANYRAKPSTPLVTEQFTTDFTQDPPSYMDMTTTNILKKNLVIDRKSMLKDPNADYSAKVSDPYGYGYSSSLSEARNADAKEIQMQESATFALGAIAGVSLIVAGLLFASSLDVSPTASAVSE